MENLRQENLTGITLDIPLFQGEGSKDSIGVASFINQFEEAAESAGLTTDNQKAIHFGNYLIGAPYCVYQNLELSDVDQSNWKEVRNYFLTIYRLSEEALVTRSKPKPPKKVMKDLPESNSEFLENKCDPPKLNRNRRKGKRKTLPTRESDQMEVGRNYANQESKMSEEKEVVKTNELIATLVQTGTKPERETGSNHTEARSSLKLKIGSVTHLMGRLINNTIQKLESSLRQDKQRPMVDLIINGFRIKALFDTGAQITCMKQATFMKIFSKGKRPRELKTTGSVTAADGKPLKQMGTYQLPFTFKNKNYEYPCKILGNLNEDMIVGINFMHLTGLSYDAGRKELFMSNAESNWRTASMQINEEVTLEPLTCAMVTINALTRDSARPGAASSAIAVVNSNDYVLNGGPALIQLNQFGQAQMEIFNCTADPMTIKKDAIIGMIEKLHPEEEANISLLNVEEMVATMESRELPEREKLSTEKEKQIRTKIETSVPTNFRQKYLDLILEYHEIFSTKKREIGPSHTAFHDIHLRDEEPVYIKQFRIPEAHRKAVEDHVKEMLKLGCIRPTRSKFNSPIFVIPQQDGGLRIVQDFRALNEKTVNQQPAMKDIQEHIDEIGRTGSKVFTNLDLTSGLWQMLLNPESRKLTAFTVPGLGQFEWIQSPMSLLGASGSFQKLLEITIHNLKNTIAHIDSLLVHTQDHEQQLKVLEQVLKRMRQSGLRANLNETIIGQEEINYLGYRINSEGSKPGIDKLKAVRDALPPTDVAEIRQFLGLCNFFKNHIRNYAVISAQLSDLTKRESKWKSGSLPKEAMKAFMELKMMMTSAPIVHHPQPELPYALITDACQGDAKKPGGFGAILAQVLPDGEFQVISYASRVLNDIEKNYAPFLLEMSASVWAMEHFRPYLKGRHFVLHTDHKPLVKLGKVHTKDLNSIQKAMLEFDFEIIHMAGAEMPADFLSRNVVNMINLESDNHKWREAQNEEPWIKECKNWLMTGKISTHPLATKFMHPHFANSLFIDDDLLWRRYHNRGEPSRVCLIIPDKFAKEILAKGHGTIFTGHEGEAKTKSRIMQHYWWRTIDEDIKEFIKYCDKCQKNRKFNHPTPSMLTPLPQCTEPNQRIHADLFGTLKAPAKSTKYILCITDAFTKYVELVVVPDKEAETVSEAIFIHWILRYGIPMEIITDQGKEFCNKLSDELYQLLNVTHNTTTAYHPQCNAQAEVANKTIKKYLQSFVDSTTFNWEEYIGPLMFAYNTSFHRTIQTSPYFLTFGTLARQPNFAPADLRARYLEAQTPEIRQKIVQEAREVAWKNSVHQHENYQAQYDQKASPHNFQVNQWVLLQQNYFLNKNAKLAEQYEGPFKILQLKGTNNAIIQVRRRKICVNTNRLKPYHGSSSFETFPKSFQKQGGDLENDFEKQLEKQLEDQNETETKESPENKENDKQGWEQPKKRKRGRPRKISMEQQRKEEEEEERRVREQFAKMREQQLSHQAPQQNRPPQPQPPQPPTLIPQHNPVPVTRQPTVQTESEEESEASETESEDEEETEDEEEDHERQKPRLFVPQLFKPKQIQSLEEYVEQEIEALVEKKRQAFYQKIAAAKAEDRIQPELTRKVNAVWQRENPIKAHYRNLIKNATPKSRIGLIKKRFPDWTEAQLINFLYSQGDINTGPDDPAFISLEQSGSIPSAFYDQFPLLRIPPAAQAPVPAPPVIDWEDEAEDLEINLPAAVLPAVPSLIRPTINLDNVRPEVQFGNFTAASAAQNLNSDEAAFFKNKFYGWSTRQNKELVQEQGRATRHNESGIRTHLKKK